MAKGVESKKKVDNGLTDFDLLKEEELPEYQKYLQQMVTVAQQDSTAAGLGPKQIALAFVVTDPRVPRTVTNFCRVVGCDRSFYYLCRQNPKWTTYKNQLARRLTEDGYDDAMAVLHQLAKLGDVKALRLFFELRGDLVQRSESTVVTETAEERMKRLRAKKAVKE